MTPVVASADYLSKNAKHPKQVLLIVTDGRDNASSATSSRPFAAFRTSTAPSSTASACSSADDTNKTEARRHARRGYSKPSPNRPRRSLFPQIGKRCRCHHQRGGQRHSHQYNHRLPLHQAARTRRLPRGFASRPGTRATASSPCAHAAATTARVTPPPRQSPAGHQ